MLTVYPSLVAEQKERTDEFHGRYADVRTEIDGGAGEWISRIRSFALSIVTIGQIAQICFSTEFLRLETVVQQSHDD